MKKFNYSEILQIIKNKLGESYFQSNRLTVDHDGHKFRYDIRDDTVMYYEDDISNAQLFIHFFCYDAENYFYLDDHGTTIYVPTSKEDWFTFNIINKHTSVDFENYKDIYNHCRKMYNPHYYDC